jgi:hypothetical protein
MGHSLFFYQLRRSCLISVFVVKLSLEKITRIKRTEFLLINKRNAKVSVEIRGKTLISLKAP